MSLVLQFTEFLGTIGLWFKLNLEKCQPFFKFIFQLEDTCFTMLGWLYCTMQISHKSAYMSFLLILPPTPTPTPLLCAVTVQRGAVPVLCRSFPRAALHTVVLMSQCCSLSSPHPLLFLLCPQVCPDVCISTAALLIGSSVPRSQIT